MGGLVGGFLVLENWSGRAGGRAGFITLGFVNFLDFVSKFWVYMKSCWHKNIFFESLSPINSASFPELFEDRKLEFVLLHGPFIPE